MSDIVEVMAKAICDLYGLSPSFNWKKYEATVRAALAALEQAGYAVVPVVPTEEQKLVARHYFGMNPFQKDGAPMDQLWLRCWTAMLSACKQVAADTAGPTRPSDQDA